MRIRASLFAILWAIIIGPFTILLVCVAGLLAGGPEARPPLPDPDPARAPPAVPALPAALMPPFPRNPYAGGDLTC